jgi:Right handed beta helix region
MSHCLRKDFHILEWEISLVRKFRNQLAGLIIFSSLSCIATVNGAVVYVDKDNSCLGSGTSTSPYCNIQAAFNVVRPGDVIRIRESATPYDERAVATRSGTPSAPIIVEPDIDHHPTLRYNGRNAQAGAIEIKDADYWQIRGLTFDGTGTQTSRYAVLLYAYSRDITGHRILQNTFRHWGGTGENTKGAAAVVLRPSYRSGFNNLFVKNSVVSDNVFEHNAHEAIHLTKTKDVIIDHNTIQHTQCGRTSDGRVGATGIKDSQGSIGTIIRNNVVHDHQRSEDCLLPNQGGATYSGIYCDTGPTDGEIAGNTVYNVDRELRKNTNPRASGVSSIGILIESRCHDWQVHGNLVYNIGIYGLRNGSRDTGDPNRTAWTNNTVYGVGRTALWIARGKNLTIKNNILIHNQGNAAIELTNVAVNQGPHSIDYNLYWDMRDGSSVGRWGDNITRDLANWQKSCSCDGAALSINPQFMSVFPGSEDFRLTLSSAARGAGEGKKDLGAYPAAPTK